MIDCLSMHVYLLLIYNCMLVVDFLVNALIKLAV